jgi:WhiB family redox-sensing transcriptional regulator
MSELRRLPGPVADLWDWQLGAACRTLPSELFFHPEGERGAARMRREARAKEVCASCPVRRSCQAHALAVREPYGIWGGLGEQERAEQLGPVRPAAS